eukprot:8310552-Alexandrium_andersonii.AAC.1
MLASYPARPRRTCRNWARPSTQGLLSARGRLLQPRYRPGRRRGRWPWRPQQRCEPASPPRRRRGTRAGGASRPASCAARSR